MSFGFSGTCVGAVSDLPCKVSETTYPKRDTLGKELTGDYHRSSLGLGETVEYAKSEWVVVYCDWHLMQEDSEGVDTFSVHRVIIVPAEALKHEEEPDELAAVAPF